MSRDYIVLECRSASDLRVMVQSHLEDAWTVYGNLIVTPEHNNTEFGHTVHPQYIQTMVK